MDHVFFNDLHLFFSMAETSNLSVADGLFILVLGGIGMVIPTPGGIGSYHAIVMIGLAVLGVGFINLSPPDGGLTLLLCSQLLYMLPKH